VRLLDGGIYDNLGLEPLDELRDECLVVLSAGGVLRTGRFGWVPVIRDLVRSEALLYRQVTALRTRTMIERFEAWEAARATEEAAPSWGRRGILFGLASEVEPSPKWPAERPPDRDPMELALTGTSFDRYPPELCERLVHQGWWLTGATLSRYHPELLPGDLPPWRPLW
jgi:NTE family protein